MSLLIKLSFLNWLSAFKITLAEIQNSAQKSQHFTWFWEKLESHWWFFHNTKKEALQVEEPSVNRQEHQQTFFCCKVAKTLPALMKKKNTRINVQIYNHFIIIQDNLQMFYLQDKGKKKVICE